MDKLFGLNRDEFNRNYNDYIYDCDTNNIKWTCLNYQELMKFYQQNYVDKNNNIGYWISDKNINAFNPFGLHYLAFNERNNYTKYLLGLARNTVGTYTIICCITFYDDYYFNELFNDVTFIDTVETNFFFQDMGLTKEMFNVLPHFINLKNEIIITDEVRQGKKCHVINNLRKTFKDNKIHTKIMSEKEANSISYKKNFK